MKNEVCDILICSADHIISEALASIIFAINSKPVLLDDYSELNDKITNNTKALLIDEIVFNKGKKVHINGLKIKDKPDIPILCLIENLPESNAYNSIMHFYPKPLDKNTLRNALIPYINYSNIHKINSTIKIGKFDFDQNKKTLSDGKNNSITLTNLEARLLLVLFKNLNITLREDFLLRQVWGYSSDSSSNTIKTHIWRLRKKIYNNDANIFILETTKKGYVLKQKDFD